MTEEMAMPEVTSEWVGDVLSRKPYADFLTKYIEGKCERDKPALVVALDAPWGSGKTFFVEHWAADLTKSKRPVVFFNAWENDYAEDPTVAFMAELRKGLEPLYGMLPLGGAARIALDNKSQEAVGYLRRALMPVLGVAAKAILKKATGIAADELIDAASGVDENSVDATDARELSAETLDKGLDRFFEKALENHSERIRSIYDFRKSLEELLILLNQETDCEGPLYVFVDELDRCRPDYAIRLLEGIKHLFSVKGVVFVVSTNLGQLSKAVGAVYGLNFDGYMYLKRFFDVEFTLPNPTRRAFIELRMKDSILRTTAGSSGLHLSVYRGHEPHTIIGISQVAEALQLDLRSIQTVLAMTEAVVLGLPAGSKVATMWLFFVAAMRHSHPDVFEFLSLSKGDVGAFDQMCARLIAGVATVPIRDRNSRARSEYPMKDLLVFYYSASIRDASSLLDSYNGMDRDALMSFPNVIIAELIEFPSVEGLKLHPISRYPSLVAMAGHISYVHE